MNFSKQVCAPCLDETSNSCPVCVSRPLRIFNRSKIVIENGVQLVEKGKQAREFFSDPKKLKLFQQYLKASAHLRAHLRSCSLTLFLKPLSCCLPSVHACLASAPMNRNFLPFSDRRVLLPHAFLTSVFASHPIPSTSR